MLSGHDRLSLYGPGETEAAPAISAGSALGGGGRWSALTRKRTLRTDQTTLPRRAMTYEFTGWLL